jgi:hypothetical protein
MSIYFFYKSIVLHYSRKKDKRGFLVAGALSDAPGFEF